MSSCFLLKCIIYNSEAWYMHIVLNGQWTELMLCCAPPCDENVSLLLFFLSIVKCYIIVFTDWVESASWPCTSVIVSICIFMFLLNGLRQFSQQIPWQTVYFCPVSCLCFQQAVLRPPTICYFCLCGIVWRLWAFNKNLIKKMMLVTEAELLNFSYLHPLLCMPISPSWQHYYV